MKTADGYDVKTFDDYPIDVLRLINYNYPLSCLIHKKVRTCVITAPKTYTAVLDA